MTELRSITPTGSRPHWACPWRAAAAALLMCTPALCADTHGSKAPHKPRPSASAPVAATEGPGGVSSAAPAHASADVVPLPETLIRIDGDSSLRKWSSTATKFNFKAKTTTEKKIDANAPWMFQEFEFVIPVKSMKSGDGKLDEHMQEAMKADKHPQIIIRLDQFKLGEKKEDGTRLADAKGEITVSGVTKPVELQASVVTDGQKVKASGQKKLLMTDFGIEPPTMMLGTIKTANEVNIVYQVAFGPRSSSQPLHKEGQ